MALEGKIDLLPLRIAMAATLLIGYISSLFFSDISKIGLVKDINWIGSTYIPSIRSAMEISTDPSKCAFVMTIQWFFVLLYSWFFFIFYCPFSTTVRVATKKWYITNMLPSGSGMRCILFLLFGLKAHLWAHFCWGQYQPIFWGPSRSSNRPTPANRPGPGHKRRPSLAEPTGQQAYLKPAKHQLPYALTYVHQLALHAPSENPRASFTSQVCLPQLSPMQPRRTMDVAN